MNTIKKINDKWIGVYEPSQEVIDFAKSISGGNWAQIQPKRVVIHVSFNQKLVELLRKVSYKTNIVTLDISAMKIAEVDKWAWGNISSATAAEKMVDLASHRGSSEASRQLSNMLASGVTLAKLEEWLM